MAIRHGSCQRLVFLFQITDTVDKDLTFELVDWLMGNGYEPYSLVLGSKLKPKYWYGWPDDIVWKHELHEFV